jgi:ZIP family zinc transporter
MSEFDDPGRVGLAFGLTIAAGMATTLGSFIACAPKLNNTKVLAFCLSLSAGVMIYISFAELMQEAIHEIGVHLTDTQGSEKYKGIIALGFFLVGVLISVILDLIVHRILSKENTNHHSHNRNIVSNESIAEGEDFKIEKSMQNNLESQVIEYVPAQINSAASSKNGDLQLTSIDIRKDDVSASPSVKDEGSIDVNMLSVEEKNRLLKAGLFTALVVSLHNFPEGLATFVATIANPSLGVSVAIAIGLHNIPEGISVSIPTYFATGSKWKSILWTFLSALSEPCGALIGYLIFKTSLSPLAFGGLFGIVSGMMVYVCIRELLPNAFAHDRKDLYCTIGFFTGLIIMAISIELFNIA